MKQMTLIECFQKPEAQQQIAAADQEEAGFQQVIAAPCLKKVDTRPASWVRGYPWHKTWGYGHQNLPVDAQKWVNRKTLEVTSEAPKWYWKLFLATGHDDDADGQEEMDTDISTGDDVAMEIEEPEGGTQQEKIVQTDAVKTQCQETQTDWNAFDYHEMIHYGSLVRPQVYGAPLNEPHSYTSGFRLSGERMDFTLQDFWVLCRPQMPTPTFSPFSSIASPEAFYEPLSP